MPQLKEDTATRFMYCLSGQFPAFDLFRRPDAWGIGITDAHRGHGGRFAKDEACSGALHVILGHQFVWLALFTGSGAGEGSHDDAVWQCQVTDF